MKKIQFNRIPIPKLTEEGSAVYYNFTRLPFGTGEHSIIQQDYYAFYELCNLVGEIFNILEIDSGKSNKDIIQTIIKLKNQ